MLDVGGELEKSLSGQIIFLFKNGDKKRFLSEEKRGDRYVYLFTYVLLLEALSKGCAILRGFHWRLPTLILCLEIMKSGNVE
jgi:hypothetical protein